MEIDLDYMKSLLSSIATDLIDEEDRDDNFVSDLNEMTDSIQRVQLFGEVLIIDLANYDSIIYRLNNGDPQIFAMTRIDDRDKAGLISVFRDINLNLLDV